MCVVYMDVWCMYVCLCGGICLCIFRYIKVNELDLLFFSFFYLFIGVKLYYLNRVFWFIDFSSWFVLGDFFIYFFKS